MLRGPGNPCPRNESWKRRTRASGRRHCGAGAPRSGSSRGSSRSPTFALLHAWHLRADFPNGSPWVCDWAKFTDEGWYGNAAIRAHLFGNWYMAGDFNPAVAVPVWPFLEWLLFFFTGVTIEAARGLAVACFFLNLVLSYVLLGSRGVSSRSPRWIALLGVTLVVTSPFLYCFSRLAILEPLQITLTLAALILAVRLPQRRRPVLGSIGIGLLFALIVLTKTTGLFLLPAVLWAMVVPLWEQRKLALRCALVMAGVAGAAFGVWMALIAGFGLLGDYRYYFFVNTYEKPTEFYWPLLSFWWSFHGLLWVDHSLILLAGAVVLAAAIAWRSAWGRKLWRDPLFGASLWAVAGYVLFMTLQNHPQPRYFAVPAFFCFFVVVLGAETLLNQAGQPNPSEPAQFDARIGLGRRSVRRGRSRSAWSANHPLRRPSRIHVGQCRHATGAIYGYASQRQAAAEFDQRR